jgi:cell volume regulation protein A
VLDGEPGSLVGVALQPAAAPTHPRTPVNDTTRYALLVLLAGLVGLAAVLANRLTERLKVPVPLIVLVGAAVVSQIAPRHPQELTIERIVTVALLLILFDGGLHIGWGRFRAALVPIAVVGVVGTFLTAGGGMLVLSLFGLSWYAALLVATAVAPTDPAVVFSVLGQREISGRSGTILEGESGANDPVGIALMASLIAAGGLNAGAAASVAGEFALQMVVGTVVGIVGGLAVHQFITKVPLPSEGLYPIRTLACALVLFGAATVAHGSGFLAVFVSGIVLGDRRAPYKREIERFHSALAGLAEIVAFAVLGFTVDLSVVARANVWVPGLVLGLVLAFVVRPLAVGLCLLPARLRRNETAFVLFAGLKGAVPVLLGLLIRAAHVPGAERLFGIVVVVVVVSVLGQGSLVPTAARLLRLPMRTVRPEPWALGVRLRDEPEGVHRLTVQGGSDAEGSTVDHVADLVGDVWISMVVRDGQLVPVRGTTELHQRDEVVALADPDLHDELVSRFAPRSGSPKQGDR